MAFGRKGSRPRGRTFDGSSKKLERTEIVPALDSPIEKGRNLLWRPSFRIAETAKREYPLRMGPTTCS